jgi:hypothetical protein
MLAAMPRRQSESHSWRQKGVSSFPDIRVRPRHAKELRCPAVARYKLSLLFYLWAGIDPYTRARSFPFLASLDVQRCRRHGKFSCPQRTPAGLLGERPGMQDTGRKSLRNWTSYSETTAIGSKNHDPGKNLVPNRRDQAPHTRIRLRNRLCCSSEAGHRRL